MKGVTKDLIGTEKFDLRAQIQIARKQPPLTLFQISRMILAMSGGMEGDETILVGLNFMRQGIDLDRLSRTPDNMLIGKDLKPPLQLLDRQGMTIDTHIFHLLHDSGIAAMIFMMMGQKNLIDV